MRRFEELDLDIGPAQRMPIRLEHHTALALYHYCLWRGLDYGKVRRHAGRMVALYLEANGEFQRWRHKQRHALSRALPSDAPGVRSRARRTRAAASAPPAVVRRRPSLLKRLLGRA